MAYGLDLGSFLNSIALRSAARISTTLLNQDKILSEANFIVLCLLAR